MAKILRNAALLALVTALWCWIMSALHGIWSFGIIRDYLDGGVVPLYPSMPVTYMTFFMYATGAFMVSFLAVFTLCVLAPSKFRLAIVLGAWLIGAWMGAANISFLFQIDFGTTWRTWEAILSLFVHGLFTPIWLFIGLWGTEALTRPLRKA
ncbi:hypothetical protein Q4555_02755 [Octadecabacter sp. 1_MG-2023]|uniref:hypothetical protein n=1 Tax=unclassified Octadecabacter TaxID=196158 RepID=UPI001C08F5DB|nr:MULTISPECIES: hypothetical protein [unclassified Octadecabacter]MBU2992977.1 hypothetical protein [Octadecabacter sp. B2R22]MDO6733571.1 hypothetical protein [Octadecabacter sp. 1_MG-2023]